MHSIKVAMAMPHLSPCELSGCQLGLQCDISPRRRGTCQSPVLNTLAANDERVVDDPASLAGYAQHVSQIKSHERLASSTVLCRISFAPSLRRQGGQFWATGPRFFVRLLGRQCPPSSFLLCERVLCTLG